MVNALGGGEGEGVAASMRKKSGFTHLDGKRSTYTHTYSLTLREKGSQVGSCRAKKGQNWAVPFLISNMSLTF